MTIKRPKSSKIYFCGTSFLLKESLTKKNLEINPPDTIVLFFGGFFSFLPFNKKITFSSKKITITMCFASTFLKKKLFHLFYSRKLVLSLLEFLNLFILQVLDNKRYNAWFVYPQDQFLYYHWNNKKSNTKIIFHVNANFFFVHAIFKILSSFFGFLLVLIYTLTNFPIISSFIDIFNCFIISHYNIFICWGLFHWQFSQEYSRAKVQD